ncbi:MAG: hypothetical protein ABIF45_17485 [Pseudomonadota bacterium]
MLDINTILFTILVADAMVVLALGFTQAVIILFDIKSRTAWPDRLPVAVFAVVISSLGAGGLLWGADYAFGGR